MWKKASQELLKYGGGILLLLGCLQFLALLAPFPDLGQIWKAFTSLWSNGTLPQDIKVSSARWLIGWIIGSSIGILFGFLTGRLKIFRLALEGLFVIFRAIPFICLLPISVLLFGLSEAGKFFLIAWASATISWVIIHDIARSVPAHYQWRAKSLGASSRKWIFRVLLPICREGIFSSLRASLSIGLIVVAVAEMGGVFERSSGLWWSEGLGYRMFRSLDQSRGDQLIASILIFALLGLFGDIILRLSWTIVLGIRLQIRKRRIQHWVLAARKKAKPFEWILPEPSGIRVQELFAGYSNFQVISNLSFDIPAGATMTVVGPSGCGKTTLIRAIGHFTDEIFYSKNGVKVGNKTYCKPGPWVGIVMQDAPVFENLTVWDNILFGNRVEANGKMKAHILALHLLRAFDLEKIASQPAKCLSGGQRQRVALAMTIANRPSLLLLDEPFGALDAITRRQLQEFYSTYISGKITAIFVTHDIEEALLVGDIIRIGVTQEAKLFHVDKNNMSPHEWELQESFAIQRSAIIVALKELKYMPKNTSPV